MLALSLKALVGATIVALVVLAVISCTGVAQSQPASEGSRPFAQRKTFIIKSERGPEYNIVVVRPQEIDDVLVNPGMGIQTFQRFNGQALESGFNWSEYGPETRLPDADKPPYFPVSTIAYCRWHWSQIEPEKGEYRWHIVDLALDEARRHNQTLAVRLMPYDDKNPLPQWYRDSGARRANQPSDKDGHVWQPDFSDPMYKKAWSELVAAFGKRYDGHPYLETVDISSIGYWGEGWSNYMPSFPHQKELIDIWIDAFPNTTLLMNFDAQKALTHGTQRGAGWRLDCLGDMRENTDGKYRWNHMMERYPQQVVRAGIQDVWQRRPVVLEICAVLGIWKKDGYDIDYSLGQALRWHVSALNIKSSPIPPQWRKNLDEFAKKMGYRFILRQIRYPERAAPGHTIPIHMWWLNAGVAPIYRRYDLAIALAGKQGRAIIKLPDDVTTWLPGDAVVDRNIFIPADVEPGSYRVLVAMLDQRTGKSAIRFAIDGQRRDGWYDIGPIMIRKG